MDDIQALADQVLDRLRQSHDFYVHTRQAWRVVQQMAHAGIVNQDYLSKAGSAARYEDGAEIQIDEPYLLGLFKLLQEVVESMVVAAIRVMTGPTPPR